MPSQPTVEVLIPLSVTWGTTTYQGGQVRTSNFQGPSYQGQPSYGHPSHEQPSYGPPYPRKLVGP